MTDLLPCPFCGGPGSLVYDSGNEVWGQSWLAGCTLCSVQFKAMGSSSWRVVAAEDEAAKAKAIANWNRRTPAWQPIETAPKGGKVVLVYDGGEMYTAYCWASESGNYWWDAPSQSIELDPTHWQPLPAPPSERAA